MIIVWAKTGVAWMERSLRSVIQVLLAERMIMAKPVELELNTKPIVTVLPKQDAEREAWLRLSGKMLEGAYSDQRSGIGPRPRPYWVPSLAGFWVAQFWDPIRAGESLY